MYTTILHATDLSDNHFTMCQQALEIAQRFNARLYLLHVLETPPSLQLAQGLGFAEIEDPAALLNDAQAVMSVLGETLKIPPTQCFVTLGATKHHILEKAKELNCQLIIIGRHTPNKIPVYLSSIAQSIVQDAFCDVLTLN